MDQHKLRTLVFEKTGVKVDSNDPIFALVALNEMVLAETVERHLARMDEASRRLEAQLRQLPGLRAAAAPQDDWEGTGEPAAAPAQTRAHAAPSSAAATFGAAALPAAPVPAHLLAAGALAIAVLAALMTCGLQALLARPAPTQAPPHTAPQPAAQTAAQTAEQAAQLARAARLERALAAVDARTRAAVNAELQKPE